MITITCLALLAVSAILFAHECKYPHMMQRRLLRLKWLFNHTPIPYVAMCGLFWAGFVSWLWYLIDGGVF